MVGRTILGAAMTTNLLSVAQVARDKAREGEEIIGEEK